MWLVIHYKPCITQIKHFFSVVVVATIEGFFFLSCNKKINLELEPHKFVCCHFLVEWIPQNYVIIYYESSPSLISTTTVDDDDRTLTWNCWNWRKCNCQSVDKKGDWEVTWIMININQHNNSLLKVIGEGGFTKKERSEGIKNPIIVRNCQ